MSPFRLFAAAALAALLSLPASAATVAVGGTGFGDTYAGGFASSIDTSNTGHPAYNSAPTSPASGWVWATDRAFSEFGTIAFTFAFDLTGYDLGSAALSGLWGVDNQGTIVLNGTQIGSLAFGYPAFRAQNAFAYTGAAFKQGLNELVFTATNAGGPGAFRASVTVTASPVPVPASLPLLAGGVLALGVIARRRKRA